MSRGSADLLDAQKQAWQSLERTAETGIRRLLAESGTTLQASLAQALEATLAQARQDREQRREAAQAGPAAPANGPRPEARSSRSAPSARPSETREGVAHPAPAGARAVRGR